MEIATGISEELYQKILKRVKIDMNVDYSIEERLKSLVVNPFVKLDLSNSTGADEDIFYIGSYNISSVANYLDIDGEYKILITFVDNTTLELNYINETDLLSDYEILSEYANKRNAINTIEKKESDPFDEDSDSDSDSDSEFDYEYQLQLINNKYKNNIFRFDKTVKESEKLDYDVDYTFVFVNIESIENGIAKIYVNKTIEKDGTITTDHVLGYMYADINNRKYYNNYNSQDKINIDSSNCYSLLNHLENLINNIPNTDLYADSDSESSSDDTSQSDVYQPLTGDELNTKYKNKKFYFDRTEIVSAEETESYEQSYSMIFTFSSFTKNTDSVIARLNGNSLIIKEQNEYSEEDVSESTILLYVDTINGIFYNSSDTDIEWNPTSDNCYDLLMDLRNVSD